MGRNHTVAEFYDAYEIAKKSGIRTLNVDLIAGLPKDNFKMFSHTLDEIIRLDPENITVHIIADEDYFIRPQMHFLQCFFKHSRIRFTQSVFA